MNPFQSMFHAAFFIITVCLLLVFSTKNLPLLFYAVCYAVMINYILAIPFYLFFQLMKCGRSILMWSFSLIRFSQTNPIYNTFGSVSSSKAVRYQGLKKAGDSF